MTDIYEGLSEAIKLIGIEDMTCLASSILFRLEKCTFTKVLS